jgi:hypothetical protein
MTPTYVRVWPVAPTSRAGDSVRKQIAEIRWLTMALHYIA